jgi:hypothetical protein
MQHDGASWPTRPLATFDFALPGREAPVERERICEPDALKRPHETAARLLIRAAAIRDDEAVAVYSLGPLLDLRWVDEDRAVDSVLEAAATRIEEDRGLAGVEPLEDRLRRQLPDFRALRRVVGPPNRKCRSERHRNHEDHGRNHPEACARISRG